MNFLCWLFGHKFENPVYRGYYRRWCERCMVCAYEPIPLDEEEDDDE